MLVLVMTTLLTTAASMRNSFGKKKSPSSSSSPPSSVTSLLTTLSSRDHHLSSHEIDSMTQQYLSRSIPAHLESVLHLPWKHLQLSSYGPTDPDLRYLYTKQLISFYPSSLLDCISSLLYNPTTTTKDLTSLLKLPQLALTLGMNSSLTSSMKQTNEEYSQELFWILERFFHEFFSMFVESNHYSQAYKIASAYSELNITRSSDWIDLLIPKVIVKVRSLGQKCRILRSYPDLFDLEIEEATNFINSFETWDHELTLIFNEQLVKQEDIFVKISRLLPPVITNVSLQDMILMILL